MVTEDRALVIHEDVPVPSLLVGSPADRVTQATMVANALAPVIQEKKLFATISGRRHVLFEGWTTLGALMGVFPVTADVHEIEGGFEAHVEARTLAGAVVGSAIARCTRAEKSWANRDDFALMSMAQTRAGSKALRMPLGFIMQLAGYEATPAEEMGVIEGTAREVPSRDVDADVKDTETKARAAFWAEAKKYGAQADIHEMFGVEVVSGALGAKVTERAKHNKTTNAAIWRHMITELPGRAKKLSEWRKEVEGRAQTVPAEQISFEGEVPAAE